MAHHRHVETAATRSCHFPSWVRETSRPKSDIAGLLPTDRETLANLQVIQTERYSS